MSEESKRIDAMALCGDISKGAENAVADWVAKAENEKSSELYLQISSPGGKLETAFAIYDRLRSTAIPVTTQSLGNVESAAVLIYLAGDRRLAGPGSIFMIHALGFSADLVTKASLPAFVECLGESLKRYGDIFKDRTKGGQALFDIDECLCNGERWINPTEAFRLGITTAPSAEYKTPEGAIWRHTR